jgi:ADP-ribose pyrophosphatase YjhB (NUDIX family)
MKEAKTYKNEKCGGLINTNNMKQETLEEAAERMAKEHCSIRVNPNTTEFQIQQFIIKGAKWQAERMYNEEDMISFAEFVATYTDKNRNVHSQMLHAKSKYDGAERTIDLLKIWFEQHKRK